MSYFFAHFDFDLLKSPGFKEDSVREELVMPLLTALGYSSSSPHKIERSKPLVHPFVYIGTKAHRIHIFPDYTLSVSSKVAWVLDAKAPWEDIRKGKHREQVYCYAMHKDVRAQFYALCNGNRFILFHVSREEPVVDFELQSLPADLSVITKHLSPKSLLHPHSANFWPDLGLHFYLLGYTRNDVVVLPGGIVELIVRLDDDSYMITSGADVGGRDLLGSFDFGSELYERFIALVPPDLAGDIRSALKRQPYHFHFPDRRVSLTIRAKLGSRLVSKPEEQFIPFDVVEFEPPPAQTSKKRE